MNNTQDYWEEHFRNVCYAISSPHGDSLNTNTNNFPKYLVKLNCMYLHYTAVVR